MKGVFVTATDTNVGKTWVGSRLVKELISQNVNIRARKPIESGWPSSEDISGTDAWKLYKAMNGTDDLEMVCPNRFAAALSPDRAAMLESTTIMLDDLKRDCLKGLYNNDFLYVEGAGGFYSPICTNGLNADLAKSLELPVILVVEDRLGCINQTLLNLEAITQQGLRILAIALNQPNKVVVDEGMDNLTDIRKRVDCEVVPFAHNENGKQSIQQLAKLVLLNQ